MTLVPSLLLTSTPGAASPASSNFRIVPGMACHWAKLARNAFNSAAVLVADQPSDARKKRMARVFGLTTLVAIRSGTVTRSQRFWAPLETRIGTNASPGNANARRAREATDFQFMAELL